MMLQYNLLTCKIDVWDMTACPLPMLEANTNDITFKIVQLMSSANDLQLTKTKHMNNS